MIPIFTRKYRTFSISVKVILMQRCLLKNNLDVWNPVSRKSSYKLMVKTKLLVVFWKTLADRKLFIFDPSLIETFTPIYGFKLRVLNTLKPIRIVWTPFWIHAIHKMKWELFDKKILQFLALSFYSQCSSNVLLNVTSYAR